jgi:hypothetical protein
VSGKGQIEGDGFTESVNFQGQTDLWIQPLLASALLNS